MALADLMDADSSSYIAHLIQMGYSDAQIADFVVQRYAYLAPAANTVAAAINAGHQAFQGGYLLQFSNKPLTASDVRPPRPGCLGWRYTTVITVHDQQSGIDQTITLEIDSPVSLSIDGLRDQATDMAEGVYDTATAGSRYLEVHAGFTVTISDVLSVERACI